MISSNYITVRTYHDRIICELVVSALNDANINSIVNTVNSNIVPLDHFEIKVHKDDVEAAIEIIESKEDF